MSKAKPTKSSTPKAKANPIPQAPQDPWQPWEDVVSKLVFKLFVDKEEGQHLLQLWKGRYFENPVVVPGKDICFTYMNEGRNDFIRQIQVWINKEMRGAQNQPTKIKRGK